MPRKTDLQPASGGGPAVASMRPRPDAAENAGCQVDWRSLLPVASMRPRPDAAENNCVSYNEND